MQENTENDAVPFRFLLFALKFGMSNVSHGISYCVYNLFYWVLFNLESLKKRKQLFTFQDIYPSTFRELSNFVMVFYIEVDLPRYFSCRRI